MTRILLIFGTRPEAVKLAPVVGALRRSRHGFECQICITSQHGQVLGEVMRVFDMRADFDLDLIRARPDLPELAAMALTRLSRVLADSRPDVVLVQGDTTTTLAGALAAFYARIPVGHVEAGLRTYDQDNPFPEEANRCLVSRLARWHFAPTPAAVENLHREGIAAENVFLTGNTVVDALRQMMACTGEPSPPPDPLLLVTAHRRENWGRPLQDICTAVQRLLDRFQRLHVVFPVHPNPEVQRVVTDMLQGRDRVQLLPPLDYVAFVQWLCRATVVLTDSGGVQEESVTLGKPTLVTRLATERPEVLASGLGRLVGTRPESIVAGVDAVLRSGSRNSPPPVSPFGDGHAADRIVEELHKCLQSGGVSALAAAARAGESGAGTPGGWA